jgi:hypothetical protein
MKWQYKKRENQNKELKSEAGSVKAAPKVLSGAAVNVGIQLAKHCIYMFIDQKKSFEKISASSPTFLLC